MAKKASARGSRKKAVVRKKNKVKVEDRQMEMIVGEKTYTVGDMAWFVDESSGISKRPKQGEITAVYPNDNIEPAVGLVEVLNSKHRAIRARLIGWSKKEANENWEAFFEVKEQKS
ncbi:MAG TPA: hypothetical protein EYQ00_05345 [Dehalococcoidia bacterium]|jgi:hypothetical protein|nr:hypothetical protein [Dehalococcoidia bacterium]